MRLVKYSRHLYWLMGWYGALQGLHIIVLLFAGYRYLQTGIISFPAPGPEGGWSDQAVSFLIGMAIVDFFIASVSLIFVYRFFVKKELLRTVGIAVLTGASLSAILFGMGTLPSGAWELHPLTYISMGVVFSPVLVLWFLITKKG